MSGIQNLLLDIANEKATTSSDSIKSFKDLLNDVSKPAPPPSVRMKDGEPDIIDKSSLSNIPPQEKINLDRRANQIREAVKTEEQEKAEFAALPWHQQLLQPAKAGFQRMAGDAKYAAAELLRDGNYIDYITSLASGQWKEEFLGPSMDKLYQGVAKLFGVELDEKALEAARITRNPIHHSLKNVFVKDLKERAEEFTDNTYNSLVKSSKGNYQKAEELNRGAHGFLADVGGVLPNTVELAGVVIGSTLVPPAAPYLSGAYLGKMGFTSYGAGLNEFDEYMLSIGEDPLENNYTRQWIGVSTAASEVTAEALMGGISRYMPSGLKQGVGQYVSKKIIGNKAGREATERALRRFASDNPKLWEKVVAAGGNQVDRAIGEIKEEGLTEVWQLIQQYFYKEAEDTPELKDWLKGIYESSKGAVLMTMLLGPVTSGSSSIQRRRRRNDAGLNIAMDRAGNVFEVTGSEEGLVIGETRLGYEVRVKQEDIVDQAFVSNDEYNAFIDGAKRGLDQTAFEAAASYRNNQTGNIEVVTTINQEDEDSPMLLVEVNDKDAVVIDFSNDENGKRVIIPKEQIHKQQSIPFDEYYQSIRGQFETIAENQINEEEAESRQQADKPQVNAGDMVEYGGMIGVLAIEPDGTMIIDGTESGSVLVNPDDINNLRPAVIIPLEGKEVPAIVTENGLEISQEYTSPEEAAAIATVLDGMYQGKKTFRVEPIEQEDPNQPNKYKVIGGDYQQPTDSPQISNELAPPPANLVNDGDGNISQFTPEAEAATADQQPTTYKLKGKEVSRGFLKAKIKNAKTRADLEGIEVSNDPELEQSILEKFPEGTYMYEADPLTRDEAIELINGAESISELEGLLINNDPEMENLMLNKFPQLKPQEEVKPEIKQETKDIPTLKHGVRLKTWRDNPNSRRYKIIDADPVSLKHLIIQSILDKGINPDFFKKEWSRSNTELRQRISILSKDGISAFDKLQESLESAHPDLFSGVSFTEFNKLLEEVVWGYPTVGKLMDEADRLVAANTVDEDNLSEWERRYIEERKFMEEAELQEMAEYYTRELSEEDINSYIALEADYNNILAQEYEPVETEQGGQNIYESNDQEVQSGSRGAIGTDDILQGQPLAQSERQTDGVSQRDRNVPDGNVREYGKQNKLVSNDRYEELRNRLKNKGGQLNTGFDPEMFAIGAEMAAYHIEAGARKFADFAKAMINDVGDWVKPYLKSFYMGARNFPGMEQYASEMDGQDVLDSTDLSTIDSLKNNSNFDTNDNYEVSEQFSQGERREEGSEDSRIEEISNRLTEGITEAKAEGEASQRDAEARVILEYAKENNLWINDIYDLGEPFSSGNENTVVISPNEGVVYKSNNLMNTQTISGLINQIKIHNQLFPHSKYSIAGFTGVDNGNNRPPYIEVVLKQQLFDNTSPATYSEIDSYMQSIGFTKTGDATYSNGQITVSDLHPRNVLKDDDGDIYVIDNIIKPSKETNQVPDTGKKVEPTLTENQQAELNKQLAEIDQSLTEQKRELDNAIKNRNKEYDKLNARNGLFGDNAAGPNDLFAGQFLVNQETIKKAMRPFEERVTNAKEKIANLENLRKETIENAHLQGDLFANNLTIRENNTNLGQKDSHVSDRTGDSQPDSGDRTNEVQPDETNLPGNRRGGRQDGNGTSPENREGDGQQGRSQRVPDSRPPLFGEGGNRDVSPDASNNSPGITGDFDGRGSRIDSPAGNNDSGGRSDGKTEGGSNNNGESFKERTRKAIEAQKAAEEIPVKLMDEANIRETLPLLLEEQQDDVIKAERRFFGEKTEDSHKWANGKGMLFTNGTGTGKTFTGLGIVKRFLKNGAKRVLIVCPASKTTDWRNDAAKINLQGRVLENTKDSGDGLLITSIENFRMNQELLKEAFDLVVYDESHKLMEDKNGNASQTTYAHYAISNRTEYDALRRLQSVHPLWMEASEIRDKIKENEKQMRKGLPNAEYQEASKDNEQLEKRWDELIKQQREIEPELKEQAKKDYERTKVVFLSATPFKSVFNLRYANGILFNWGDETTYTQASRGMSRVDPESRFFLDNFGAQFQWRYHRLESKPDRNDEAVAMQEVEFAQRMMEANVMSGRTIESNMDYGREFPVVATSENFNSEAFNKAYSDIYDYDTDSYKNLREAAREVFMSHHEATLLFEVLTTSMSMDRIQAHLDMGRKVAVYHRRQNGTSQPPFERMLLMANNAAKNTLQSEEASAEEKEKARETINQVERFRDNHKDVLDFEQTLDYRPAPVQIKERFGDRAAVFTEATRKDRANIVAKFNNDDSGLDIIIVQEQSGKEGISLHDTTGKHPRVVMQMSKPNSSIAALQIEGRIYRIGQESNAIFEYPVLGLDMELAYYGSNLNKRLSTTENLAMGNQSRDLIRSFSEGILYNANPDAPNQNQGIGGKEFDRREKTTQTPFQRARLVYATNQKSRGRRDQREGVDFYATPEPVGQKMVEWANVRPGDDMLEPSAGMGSIAMWMPKHGSLTAIEPSYNLFAKMSARTGDLKKKVINDTFESLHAVNKFETIVMNPPFGQGGKLAMDHLEKAFMHLKENGRVVALIPRGQMDKRLERFLYGEDDKGRPLNPNAHLVASINLPPSTFEQAGTAVSTRIVIIDKVRPDQEGLPQFKEWDLSDAKNIDELFDRIESIQIQERLQSEAQADFSEAVKQGDRSALIGKTEYAGEVLSEMTGPLVSYLEQKHSKTGAVRHTVPIAVRVDRDTYSKLNSMAKALGGFYNSWNKQGSKAGFEFKSKEDADTFIQQVNSNSDDANDDGTRFKRRQSEAEATPMPVAETGKQKGVEFNFGDYRYFAVPEDKGKYYAVYEQNLKTGAAPVEISFDKFQTQRNKMMQRKSMPYTFHGLDGAINRIDILKETASIVDRYGDFEYNHAEAWEAFESVLKTYPSLMQRNTNAKQVAKELMWDTYKALTEKHGVRFKRGMFYSPTERALSKIKQDKGTPDQFKAMLLKNGAKEVELNWMGWDKFARDKRVMTKAEVQEWIDSNKVELEEVVKGRIENNNKYSIRQDGDVFDVMVNGKYSGKTFGTEEEAEAFVEESKNTFESETKYEGYILAGGENYREVLLRMPRKSEEILLKNISEEYEYEKKGYTIVYNSKDGNNYAVKQTNPFKSGHWDEPNIVVHVRMQDFVDKEGRKVLLIEEIQSDWAQKGKKEGFEPWKDKTELPEGYTVEFLNGTYRVHNPNRTMMAGIAPDRDEAIRNALQIINSNKLGRKVADMPFKQTPQWTGLALKRMLQYASEGGYDMIAWTTGEQQAERFDLSKQVDSITYTLNEGIVRIYPKFDPTPIAKRFNNENELADIVGKEIAQKIYAKEGKKTGNGDNRELKSIDLKVGGEGMKAFYDSILPSTARKVYGKTAKVGTTEIFTPKFESGGELNDNTTTVHAIELTDELKDMGSQEQAMFKKELDKRIGLSADEYFQLKERVKQKFERFKQVSRKGKEGQEKFGEPIVTVRTIDALPEHVRKRLNPQDRTEIQGVFDPKTGVVFLVSDNLDPEMAEKVILHEILAHKGVRKVLGDKLRPVLEQVYNSMPEADRKAISKLYSTTDELIIADEYIAEIAENYKRPNLLNKVVAKIRNLIREMFGINYSKADILYLLSRSEDYYNLKKEPSRADFATAEEYIETKKQWDNDSGVLKKRVLQIDTMPFKEWFGKSKIVNANGEPHVYYHATGADFDSFTPNAKGLIFASPDAQWAQGGFMPLDKEAGTSGSVMPVYVKAENPFDYRNEEQLNKLLESLDVRETIKEHIRNGSPWGLEKPAVIKAIKDAGFDGFFVTEEGITNIAVFEPTQVKSATGNSGDFDPNNPDVRFKRKSSDSDNAADLSKTGDKAREKLQDRMITVKRVQQEVAKRAGMEKLPWWMDAYNQENRSHGRILNETERVNKFLVDPLIKAVILVTQSNTREALQELQRYLKAKHAPERNRVISKRKDLDSVENQSGFTDEEAAQIVLEYESTHDMEAIDDLWKKVNALTNYTLKSWFDNGFISKAQYDELTTGEDAYKFYVPLRGHKDVAESVFEYQNSETGKHVNPYRKAEGRISESDDPIQYMVNMAQTAIVMGENNKIKQYAYRMASNYENKDLYHIKKTYYVNTGTVDANGKEVFVAVYERPPQQLWDENKVEVRYNNKRMAIDKRQADEHEVQVMVGGERIIVRFENPEVANAINKNNVATFTGNNWLESLARVGGAITRIITANFTAKNPGFIIPNTVRDVSYAWISHAIKGEGHDAAKFIKHLATANKSMSHYSKWEQAKQDYENARTQIVRDAAKARMDKYDTKEKKLMEGFLSNGAATGYVHIKDVDTLGKEIEKELTRAKRAEIGNAFVFNNEGYVRLWHTSGKILESLAQRSENMSRLATYILAVENGKSQADAASEAKNITVNFNRKGSQSNVLGSMYAFLNASIQGGENIARIAKEHPKKFVLGASMIYSMGFLVAMLSHLNDDDDDDEKENKYKNINDYTKQNHLTIRYGNKKYISIPLPHGWRSFYGLGVSTFENLFLDQEKKSKFNWAREDRAWDKLVYDFADRTMDAVSSVNPVDALQGGDITIGSVMRVIAPTVTTPWIDILTNRDFAGREIYQVPYTKMHGQFDANAGQFRKNVNFIAKRLTDKLYQLGGGDIDTYTRIVLDKGETKEVSGFADWNPSKIEHLVTYYTGGRGAFFNDLFKTTTSVVEGMHNMAKNHPEPFESFDSNNIPVLNRFDRIAYDYDDYKWYYGLKDEIQAYKYNRSKLSIERQLENINPRVEMLDDIVKDTDKQLKELRALLNEPAIIADPRKVVEIKRSEKKILKGLRKGLEQYTP